MLEKFVAVLALVSVALIAWVVFSTPSLPSLQEMPARQGPAPFEGRSALDHQGQPQIALPEDEKIKVTGETPR